MWGIRRGRGIGTLMIRPCGLGRVKARCHLGFEPISRTSQPRDFPQDVAGSQPQSGATNEKAGEKPAFQG